MIGYEQPKKPAVAKTVPVSSADLQGAKLFRWMLDRAQEFGLRYLLAHADDGVIWGRVDDENGLLNLITARDAASEYDRQSRPAEPISIYCPALREVTLQQARLFSETAELLIWREDIQTWQARLIQDVCDPTEATWDESYIEPQMLWGNQGLDLGGCTKMLLEELEKREPTC